MKKNTIILSCFPLVGRTYLTKNQNNFQLSILDSDSDNFYYAYRKRTNEELEKIREHWDSVPHLLSGEGYINQIRGELIKDKNPEFPMNYLHHIKLHMGDEDVILASSKNEVRQAMRDAGLKYMIVLPSERLYCEWIGRAYLAQQEGTCKYTVKEIQRNWNEWIHSCMKDPSNKIIIDEPNTFLSDLIHDIAFNTDKVE